MNVRVNVGPKSQAAEAMEENKSRGDEGKPELEKRFLGLGRLCAKWFRKVGVKRLSRLPERVLSKIPKKCFSRLPGAKYWVKKGNWDVLTMQSLNGESRESFEEFRNVS